MNHSFDVDHATKYGLPAAIMIGNFQFWITKNRANGDHFFDGYTWTYNSVKAYSMLFPYLSSDQVRRTLDKLVAEKIMLCGNFNVDRSDRTKWFAFADEKLFLPHLANLPNEGKDSPAHLAKMPNAFGKSAKSLTTTDVNPDGGRATRLSAAWILPESYGAWALAEFPKWDDVYLSRVARMFHNHWIGVAGTKAHRTNWFATWQNWCLREPSVLVSAKPAATTEPWHASDAGIIAKGSELGLVQLPGERTNDYRWRIEDQLRDAILDGRSLPLLAPAKNADLSRVVLSEQSLALRTQTMAAMKNITKAKNG